MVNPERGLLKDVLHNETLELETEMVIAIMKDVASALKYLHHLDPPILDKVLTSYGVMLTVDYCAQLVHLHHADVRPWCPPCMLTYATDVNCCTKAQRVSYEFLASSVSLPASTTPHG